MGLDISKLENVRHQNGVTTARCPACAKEGHDSKGDHLFVDRYGRYGCVIYPGKAEAAHDHRKRIFELVGTREGGGRIHIEVREVKRMEIPKVIESNILGHLGHYKSSQEKTENIKEAKTASKDAATVTKSEVDIEIGVPSVPDNCGYTVEELSLIQSEDEETLRIIHYAKTIFSGTIIPYEPINIRECKDREIRFSNAIIEGGGGIKKGNWLSMSKNLYKRKELEMSKSKEILKKHASSGQFLKIEDGGQAEAVYLSAEDVQSNFDRSKTNIRYRLKIDGAEKWLESGSRSFAEQMSKFEEGDTIIIKRVGQFKDTTYTVEKAV